VYYYLFQYRSRVIRKGVAQASTPGGNNIMKKIINQQEKLIKEQKQMISEQGKALKIKDKAISELLNRTASEKAILEGAVVSNVNLLIIPLIQKLLSKDRACKLAKALRNNIERLTEPIIMKMHDKRLSKKETEVCNLIKEGKNTSEIAQELKIKVSTMEKHRQNIRHKLGISQSGHNLYQVLMHKY
jgi:DNA-binding CsgD family transcriptional regulator